MRCDFAIEFPLPDVSDDVDDASFNDANEPAARSREPSDAMFERNPSTGLSTTERLVDVYSSAFVASPPAPLVAGGSDERRVSKDAIFDFPFCSNLLPSWP